MTVQQTRISAVVRLVACVCTCAALAACRSSSPPPTPSADVVLTIGVPFNAAGERIGLGSLAGFLNQESLVRTNRDGRPQPLLAEKSTVSADGLIITFALKPGVRFHDGALLTAPIAAASLDRSLKTPAQLAQNPFLRDIAGIEASGDRDLIVRLSRPSPLVFENLDIPITRTFENREVSPGPFVFVSGGKEPSLRANRHYHRGKPLIDVVRFKTYEAVRPAWAALMRGEIDFLYEVGPESRQFVEEETSVRVHPYQRAFGTALVPNLHRPMFRSAAVRRALNLAIHRQEIIDRVFRGRGTPSSGLWPQHWLHRGHVASPAYDPVRADALLTASGLPRPQMAHASTDGMPSRLRFTCLVPPRWGALERVALMIQHQLQAIGVDMQIEALPVDRLVERMQKGDFDAVLMDMAGGPGIGRMYYLWHSAREPGLPDFGYRAADAALDKIRGARDEATAYEGADELRRVFAEDPPAIFINWSETARALSRRFEVEHEEGRDVFGSVWRMKRVTGP